MVIHNFINNEFAPVSTTTSYYTKQNPFNDSLLNKVVQSQPIDLVMAIQGAQKCFQEWRQSTLNERRDLLQKIIKSFDDHFDQLTQIESRQIGLSRHFVRDVLKQDSQNAFLSYEKELNQQVDFDQYSAVGVVGIVLSWNISSKLILESVISAILAGNAVIVKTSSQYPGLADIWGKIFIQAQIPKGLVQILNGNSLDFKKVFVSHPGIKAIKMYGHLQSVTQVQKIIAEHSFQQIKKICFLSGSKNASIVLSDVNEVEMKKIFDTFMIGQGQLCWNATRLFVLEKNESIWHQFIEDQFRQLKPAEDENDISVWGPLINSDSHDLLNRFRQQVTQDKGQIIQAGNSIQSNQKNFYQPVFTKDMSNCSTLQQEEVAGPIFIFSTVKYPFDIPKYANVSYYGHSANIWTDPDKNLKVIQQLDVGCVSRNKWALLQATEPIVGVKQTTFGIADHRIFGAFNSNVKKLL